MQIVLSPDCSECKAIAIAEECATPFTRRSCQANRLNSHFRHGLPEQFRARWYRTDCFLSWLPRPFLPVLHRSLEHILGMCCCSPALTTIGCCTGWCFRSSWLCLVWRFILPTVHRSILISTGLDCIRLFVVALALPANPNLAPMGLRAR